MTGKSIFRLEQEVVPRLRILAARITYPGFEYVVTRRDSDLFLHVECPEGVCNETGALLPWKSRKWLLSQHMTDGEFVQTAFLATERALIHEARERFRVDGLTVLNSHVSLSVMLESARRPDFIQERVDTRREEAEEASLCERVPEPAEHPSQAGPR